ncbi:MAG: DedA family protein [Tetrasphaera sp.]
MQDLLTRLLSEPAWIVYLVVGLVVFAEDALFVGFMMPGESAAILGGVSAALGHTSLTWMIVIVCAAAIVGDSVGFEVGRHLGGRLLENPRLTRHRPRVDAAQGSLRRRGASAVFLGRWTAFLRALIPALAGAARMPYRTFLAWNAVGGILWGIVMVVAGHLAGASYQRVAHWLGTGSAVVLALVVVIALTVWHLRRSHGH